MSKLNENLKKLADGLEESDEVKVDENSSAVITTEDGQPIKLDYKDCRKFFATVNTVKALCDTITSVNSASIELYSVTLPDEVMLELEERFALVEEL